MRACTVICEIHTQNCVFSLSLTPSRVLSFPGLDDEKYFQPKQLGFSTDYKFCCLLTSLRQYVLNVLQKQQPTLEKYILNAPRWIVIWWFWCSVSSQFISLISSMFLLCLFYIHEISSVFFLILCLCKICFLSFFVTLHDLYPVLGLHFLQFSDKIIAFHTKLTLIDKLDAPNDWCSSVDSSGIRVFIFIQNSGKHQDYWFSNQRTNDELHDLNEAFHSHFVWRRERERRFHNSNEIHWKTHFRK